MTQTTTQTAEQLAERLWIGANKIKPVYEAIQAGKADDKLKEWFKASSDKWLNLELEWGKITGRGVEKCPLVAHGATCRTLQFGVMCAWCQVSQDDADYKKKMADLWQNPHRKRPGLKLFNGDCLEMLDAVPDGSVQLVMTSPPYWNLRDYYKIDRQIGVEGSLDLYIDRLVAVFRKVRRKLDDTGVCYIVMGDTWEKLSRMDVPHTLGRALREDGWIWNDTIIWTKNTIPSSKQRGYTNTYEEVLFMAKSDEYYTDIEAAKVPTTLESKRAAEELALRFGNPLLALIGEEQVEGPKGRDKYELSSEHHPMTVHNIGKVPKKGEAGLKVPPNVWFLPIAPSGVEGFYCPKCHGYSETTYCHNCGATGLEPLKHSAIYPESLCWLPILSGTKPNQVVLDPFAGLGTTGVVCRKLGRRCILMELLPAYCQYTIKRIDTISMPLKAGA